MRGFTAVELLVSIAIVALITTLTLVDFRSATRLVRLELEAQKIALEIRRAQSLAAHARQFAGTAPCGYGLYFDPLVSPGPGSFIIFAELTSLPGGCSEPFSYVSESAAVDADGTVEQVRLNEDVQITALSQPRLTVFFLTPAPTTSFSSVVGGTLSPVVAPEVSITVALKSEPSIERRIVIRRSGQISIVTP